jgi:hypothetical protein
MDESHEVLEEGQVSRRDALKKMAAGAVGFWAVPIISSFRSPAFAQVIVSPSACVDFDCTQAPQFCGNTPGCGFLADCLCDVDVDGNEVCWQNVLCSDSPTCATNADCPPTWSCATSCCSPLTDPPGQPTCIPPCGTCVTSLTTSGANAAGR